jgi:hypothetical protein
VLDGPVVLRDGPGPGVSVDAGDRLRFDLYVSPELQRPSQPLDYRVIDIKGVDGIQWRLGDDVIIAWSVTPGAWAVATALGFSIERAIGIAAATPFVDRATWEATYNENLDSYGGPTTAATTTTTTTVTATTTAST